MFWNDQMMRPTTGICRLASRDTPEGAKRYSSRIESTHEGWLNTMIFCRAAQNFFRFKSFQTGAHLFMCAAFYAMMCCASGLDSLLP